MTNEAGPHRSTTIQNGSSLTKMGRLAECPFCPFCGFCPVGPGGSPFTIYFKNHGDFFIYDFTNKVTGVLGISNEQNFYDVSIKSQSFSHILIRKIVKEMAGRNLSTGHLAFKIRILGSTASSYSIYVACLTTDRNNLNTFVLFTNTFHLLQMYINTSQPFLLLSYTTKPSLSSLTERV